MSHHPRQPARRAGPARRLWRALGSLRLGVVLLVLVAAACTVGVVLPQPESFDFDRFIETRFRRDSPRAFEPGEFLERAEAAGIGPRGPSLADFAERVEAGDLGDREAQRDYSRVVEFFRTQELSEERRLDILWRALGQRARSRPVSKEEWRALYAEVARRAEAQTLSDGAWQTFLLAFVGRVNQGPLREACVRLGYVDSYGLAVGRVLLFLRLHAVFASAWFRALCLLLAVNLVVCSLRRLPRQWRAAFGLRAGKDPEWYRKRATWAGLSVSGDVDRTAAALDRALEDQGFRVVRRRGPRVAVREASRGWLGGLARLWWPLGKLAGAGRLGSQVVHLGVLLVIVGGFLAGRLSFRHPQLLAPGEVAAVPDVSYRLSLGYQMERVVRELGQWLGVSEESRPSAQEAAAEAVDWRRGRRESPPRTAFRLRLRDFEFRTDARGKPEYFGAHVTVLNGTVQDHVIEVNRPLTYRGFTVYQQGWRPDWRRLSAVTFRVLTVVRSGPEGEGFHGERRAVAVAEEVLVTIEPGADVRVPGTDLTLRVRDYYPHWSAPLEEGPDGRPVAGTPHNLSDQPRNPFVLLHLETADGTARDRWVGLPVPRDDERRPQPRDAVDIASYRVIPVDCRPGHNTWLRFSTHPVMLPVWVGCGVMMLGIFLCFYCNHERVWALVRLREEGGCEVLLAGSAFKWRERFRERFRAVVASMEGANEDAT
ncbi:MAG: cytochrome c biogenesis protein ResB [Candidatus Brocadiia bacterium]